MEQNINRWDQQGLQKINDGNEIRYILNCMSESRRWDSGRTEHRGQRCETCTTIHNDVTQTPFEYEQRNSVRQLDRSVVGQMLQLL